MFRLLSIYFCFSLFFTTTLYSFYGGCNNFCKHNRLRLYYAANEGTYEQNPLLHNYDVSFYKLNVNVEPDALYIDGDVTILAKVLTVQLDTIVLELKHYMEVEKIILNGVDCNFEHKGNEIFVFPQAALTIDDYFEIIISYSGSPESGGFFSGMNIGTCSYGNPVMWTLSEPLNARQWWPCKQVLEDKADSVHVFITTSNEYMAASNGLLTNTINLPNEKVRYEWKSNYPIAYYLISLAVGNYKEYNFYAPIGDKEDSVFVQNFIYNHPEALTLLKDDIDYTKDFLKLFSQLFGAYPFADEKYGHAMAPMGGGMEHQTISTMQSFNYNLTSHELAHHWFGNNVTCAAWNDIWINEGFATYSEYLALQYLEGQNYADTWMDRVHNSVISRPDGSVYVPYSETNDVWRIFDGRLSYRKGAAILHLLRFELDSDELFFDILKEFQNRFKNGVASGEDFIKVVEDITSKSWQWFFDQWYYGEGYPEFVIRYNQEKDTVFVGMSQEGSANNPDYFKTSIEIQLIGKNTDTVVRVFQSERNQIFSFYFTEKLQNILFDPDNYLFKKVKILPELRLKPALLKIYPNPVLQNIIIEGYANGSGKLEVNIFDSQGKKYYNTSLPVQGGIINTNHWSAGNYIINVSDSENNFINKKIIKIK